MWWGWCEIKYDLIYWLFESIWKKEPFLKVSKRSFLTRKRGKKTNWFFRNAKSATFFTCLRLMLWITNTSYDFAFRDRKQNPQILRTAGDASRSSRNPIWIIQRIPGSGSSPRTADTAHKLQRTSLHARSDKNSRCFCFEYSHQDVDEGTLFHVGFVVYTAVTMKYAVTSGIWLRVGLVEADVSEATCSSETSVPTRPRRHHILEDDILRTVFQFSRIGILWGWFHPSSMRCRMLYATVRSCTCKTRQLLSSFFPLCTSVFNKMRLPSTPLYLSPSCRWVVSFKFKLLPGEKRHRYPLTARLKRYEMSRKNLFL
jgi:hypothetical protein